MAQANNVQTIIGDDGVHKMWIIKGDCDGIVCDGCTVTRNGNSVVSMGAKGGTVTLVIRAGEMGMLQGLTDFTNERYMVYGCTASGDLVLRSLDNPEDVYWNPNDFGQVQIQERQQQRDEKERQREEEERQQREAQERQQEEERTRVRRQAIAAAGKAVRDWDQWVTAQERAQNAGQVTPKSPYQQGTKLIIEEDGVFYHGSFVIQKRGNRGVVNGTSVRDSGNGAAQVWVNNCAYYCAINNGILSIDSDGRAYGFM